MSSTMRTLLLLTLLLALTTTPARAQSVPAKTDGAALAAITALGAYAVPFASEGNVLELAVANTDAAINDEVAVTVVEVSTWLVVEPAQVVLTGVDAGEEVPATFTFSVVQSAPVGEVAVVRFAITAKGALLGEKEIRLQVEAPQDIALGSNYPNPFNPQTTIGYTLPQTATVSLRIYDVLGREVACLVEGEHGAGYHEAVWQAGRFASGVYLYRLMVEAADGARTLKQRTMLLVK